MSLAAVVMGTGAAAAATPSPIAAPSLEYSQLAPMLVVFGAAVIGVLVEAFVPRELRRAIHLLLTFGALVAAFVWTCVIAASSTIFAKGSPGHVAAMGAVAVDRPTLFIQGTILVLAIVSVMLIADASHDESGEDAVISEDPLLAPIGRALSVQFGTEPFDAGYSVGPGGLMIMGPPAIIGRLRSGTLLRYGRVARLESVSRAPIPPSAFALPAPPMSRAAYAEKLRQGILPPS